MPYGVFTVECCSNRRGLINGVLVCSKCDYDNDKATVIPNESKAKDVPEGLKHWSVFNGEPE